MEALDLVNSTMQWIVAPIAAFVWLIYMRQGEHHTDIALLKQRMNDQKQQTDQAIRDVKVTLDHIYEKLDGIEAALRK
jgi:hypothetical protein